MIGKRPQYCITCDKCYTMLLARYFDDIDEAKREAEGMGWATDGTHYYCPDCQKGK